MKRWNKIEYDKLLNLNEKGLKYSEIAFELNRTIRSIKNKLNKNNIYQSDDVYYEIVICEKCGNEFKSLKSEKRKYCSKSCSSKINNVKFPKRIKKEKLNKSTIIKDINYCLNCEKELKKQSQKKFCSLKCQRELEKKQKYDYYINNQDDFNNKIIHISSWLKNTILEQQSHKCDKCGCIDEWNGEKLIFVLDHIDGNAKNNTRENFRLVCPNCDSQLDTYKSKNKNSERSYRKKYYK